MRRAVPIVFATLLGLGLLANFHSSPAQTVSSTPGPARPTTPVTTPTPVAGASPPRTSGPSTAPSTTAPAATLGTRVVDGPAVVNRYGPVQVEVTLSGDRIVDVQALELPSDRAKSVRINDVAGPLLREEALTAQSARVDTVSGATYTSLSYQQSLQAALDQAGIS